MYAVVKDGKFNGVVYNTLTPAITAHHEQYGESLVMVQTPPINMGTEDEPDYGSPTPEQLNHQRISEIKAELSRIDLESVRPLRAINAGTDTQLDQDKLAELDAHAVVLRQELERL